MDCKYREKGQIKARISVCEERQTLPYKTDTQARRKEEKGGGRGGERRIMFVCHLERDYLQAGPV